MIDEKYSEIFSRISTRYFPNNQEKTLNNLGEKKSSAQLTAHYTPAALIGKKILAVVNFPPRQIGKVMSEVLVLGVPDSDGEVVLIGPDTDVPVGGRVF